MSIEEVTEKIEWYKKYRTTIWGVVWFLVGLFGGNVDRLKESLPAPGSEIRALEIRVEKIETKIFGEVQNGKMDS